MCLPWRMVWEAPSWYNFTIHLDVMPERSIVLSLPCTPQHFQSTPLLRMASWSERDGDSQDCKSHNILGAALGSVRSCVFQPHGLGERPGHVGLGVLTRLRSRSRSSRMAFMVALVLFSSSSLLHSMAVRLSFSSLSPASSFSQRDRSSARLGYRSRPSTPSISSTVWKAQRQGKWVTWEKGGGKETGKMGASADKTILQSFHCQQEPWLTPNYPLPVFG